jgi:hypothetical protein
MKHFQLAVIGSLGHQDILASVAASVPHLLRCGKISDEAPKRLPDLTERWLCCDTLPMVDSRFIPDQAAPVVPGGTRKPLPLCGRRRIAARDVQHDRYLRDVEQSGHGRFGCQHLYPHAQPPSGYRSLSNADPGTIGLCPRPVKPIAYKILRRPCGPSTTAIVRVAAKACADTALASATSAYAALPTPARRLRLAGCVLDHDPCEPVFNRSAIAGYSGGSVVPCDTRFLSLERVSRKRGVD